MGNRKEQSQNPNKYKKAEYLHRQWKHANSTEQKKKKKKRYTELRHLCINFVSFNFPKYIDEL